MYETIFQKYVELFPEWKSSIVSMYDLSSLPADKNDIKIAIFIKIIQSTDKKLIDKYTILYFELSNFQNGVGRSLTLRMNEIISNTEVELHNEELLDDFKRCSKYASEIVTEAEELFEEVKNLIDLSRRSLTFTEKIQMFLNVEIDINKRLNHISNFVRKNKRTLKIPKAILIFINRY
ncbi:MAG: hypothetical protein FMNOHCHN_01842 [Ignavibacteriaceae bacterium]|nr:hypothetical protein [Ignavibacteriaceae bacterium]